MFEGDDNNGDRLNLQDRLALDAIFDAGPNGHHEDQTRLGRVRTLLALIGRGAPAPDDALTDLTMLRIRRFQRVPAETSLVELDHEALDALVFAGFDPGRVNSALRPRARRLCRFADLITDGPTLSSESLTQRTLERISRANDGQSMPIARGRRRIRMGDLISIAALILIAASLILPVMGALRDQRFQTVCRNNMLATAMGLSGYAVDNQDSLPMVTAGFGSNPWWSVGDPKSSNSANLYHLARGQYVTLEELACAGNRVAPTRMADANARDWRDLEEVSYAYRIMSGPSQPRWQSSERFVVIADRSPVVLRSARGFSIVPSENSPNHDGLGQQVLLNDGSSRWLTTPIAPGGDNIWLPRQVEDAIRFLAGERPVEGLSGLEAPASIEDSFVGP